MPSAVCLIRIGISSCLLGQEVRYDGDHKRDRFLTDVLGRFVEWVPVCPEVEVGMGIPRPMLRLVRSGDDLRMVAERSGEDHTRGMRSFARKRVAALRKLDLAGYVLKKDSPSCGMARVRLYGEKGMPEKKGRGLFAQALLEGIPQLPIEEEGRLHDPALRENFIERVFAYRRLRDLFRGRWSVSSLVAFHAAHKLQLMSHEPQAYQRLGRLVGEAKSMDRDALRSRYTDGFMEALVRKATPRRNVNAMHHMLGFFRKHLDARSKQELLGLIEDYRNGRVPLVVPLTLIRHHVERCDIACLRDQHYLAPHPVELMLRNRV